MAIRQTIIESPKTLVHEIDMGTPTSMGVNEYVLM
jgi:hypothetical protein